MTFLPQLPKVVFDQDKYTATLNKRIGGVFREAVRTYFRVLLQSGIPVETGMAKAAIVPIAQEFGRIGGLTITPVRDSYFSALEGTVQNVHSGLQKAEYHIIDNKNNDKAFFFELVFDPGVIHFWNKNYYNGAVNGEERMDYASRFFIAYVKTSFLRDRPDLDLRFEY